MSKFFRKLFLPITIPLDFITKYFKTVVFLTILFFIFNDSNTPKVEMANLQKIDLSGPILDVSKTLQEIQKASKNANIKGVLLNVNSPGGAVAPSVEVAYAIKELSSKKPVVAYASGVMASGGYYASIWATRIVANPGSMVGSIGVIFQGMNLEELMKTIGIKEQVIKAGKYKEAGTFSRPWNEYEKEELNSVIQDTYKMFVIDVANARKLKLDEYKNYAEGRIFTAHQAKKVGLIDEVATISFAQNELFKLSGVTNPIWTKEDKFDKFLNKVINEAFTQFSIRFSEGLKAY